MPNFMHALDETSHNFLFTLIPYSDSFIKLNRTQILQSKHEWRSFVAVNLLNAARQSYKDL